MFLFLFASVIQAQELPTPSPSVTPTPVVNTNIFITEISQIDELVELYNQNDFAVDLNNWVFVDLANNHRTISNQTIQPQSYLVVSTGSSFLNNTPPETLTLENSQNELVDQVVYDEVKDGYLWSKKDDGWCFALQTMGAPNVEPCWQTPTSTSTPTSSPTHTPSPTKTPTPTKTPSSTKTPSPTKTPAPSLSFTIAPTITPIPTFTPAPTDNVELTPTLPLPTPAEDVKGISDIVVSPSPTPVRQFQTSIIPKVFIGLGSLLLLVPLLISKLKS